MTQEIISKVRELLFTSYSAEQIGQIEAAFLSALDGYEITKKCTALVVHTDADGMLVKKFCLAKGVQGLSARSIELYVKNITRFINSVNKRIGEVTPDDIRIYLAKKKMQGVSDNYLANILRSLSTFYTWLRKEDYITKSPVDKVETIKIHKKVELALTEEQMELVRFECKTKRDKALIEFLYSTGCRVGEVAILLKTQVDFDNNEIIVTGKGGKQRLVYLSQRAKYLLLDYIESRKDESPYLFTEDYTQMTPKQYEAFMRQKAKKQGRRKTPEGSLGIAGIQGVCKKLSRKLGFRLHPHLIRKTMASSALHRGMTIDKIQKLLGHESVATTTIYAQTNQSDVKREHERYIS